MEKKKKWWIIGTVSLIAILAVVVIVILIAGSSSDEEFSIEDAQQLIDVTIKDIFTDSAEGSYELKALKEAASVSVVSTSVDGDSATATCSIQSINVGEELMKLFSTYEDKTITKANYEEIVKSAVDSAEATETEKVLSFTRNEEGNWVADDLSYEVYDAYLGGYLTFMQEAITKMGDAFNE